MERKDFLKTSLALCTLAFIPIGVIESCKKSTSNSGPTNVNFTLDLNNSANSALNTVGGFLLANGVIIIRSSSSVFNALSATCTHDGCSVGYNASTAKVSCPCHGGMFDPNTGSVVAGPPPSPLTKYTVNQAGTVLTVKS